MVKVFIGMTVPAFGLMYTKTFISLLSLDKPEKFTFHITRGGLVDWERNNLVMEMLKDPEFTHLFFVDGDMVILKDALMKLIDDDEDVVSGLYFQRTEPHLPVIYKKNEKGNFAPIGNYENDRLFEVDAAGAGCMLVKREVFEKLMNKVPINNGVPTFFNANFGMTEDMFFCDKAKQNGFKIHCDSRIKCGHIDLNVIEEKDFRK